MVAGPFPLQPSEEGERFQPVEEFQLNPSALGVLYLCEVKQQMGRVSPSAGALSFLSGVTSSRL